MRSTSALRPSRLAYIQTPSSSTVTQNSRRRFRLAGTLPLSIRLRSAEHSRNSRDSMGSLHPLHPAGVSPVTRREPRVRQHVAGYGRLVRDGEPFPKSLGEVLGTH